MPEQYTNQLKTSVPKGILSIVQDAKTGTLDVSVIGDNDFVLECINQLIILYKKNENIKKENINER